MLSHDLDGGREGEIMLNAYRSLLRRPVAMAMVGLIGLFIALPQNAFAQLEMAPWLDGALIGVDTVTGGIVVETSSKPFAPGEHVSLLTDADTLILIDRVKSKIADLKPGMLVKVKYVKGQATVVVAGAKAVSMDDVTELRGIVASVDSATLSFMILTERVRGVPGPKVRVMTDANTVFNIDGAVRTIGFLSVGMFVTVVPPTGIAISVYARTGAPKAPAPEAAAEVAQLDVTVGMKDPDSARVQGMVVSVAVSTGRFVIATRAERDAPGKQLVVITDARTPITIDGQPGALADMKAGMYVKVQPAADVEGKVEATTSAPLALPLRGVISNVDAPARRIFVTETLNGVPGRPAIIATDADTAIKIDGLASMVADLKSGMFVTVRPPRGTAARIEAHTKSPGAPLRGAVQSVDAINGDVMVVTPPVPLNGVNSLTIRVITSPNTGVAVDGKPAAVADLKPGMLLEVEPATGVATYIEALTVAPPL
jgi:hypothetical protein